MKASKAVAALLRFKNPEKAAFFPRFFKTGPGQYGEGDRFIGVTVPHVRQVAREYRELPLGEIRTLLRSPYNEVRLLAVLLLGETYRKGDVGTRERVYRLYLRSLGRVNNWNLVDASAPNIVGEHLLGRSRKEAYALARSGDLWKRRVAIVASLRWIRAGDFGDTLGICEVLMGDGEDLIHKACGWMLREVGKRDEGVLRGFLDRHAGEMPRTMLRYAIERMGVRERKRYLGK